MKAPLFVLMVLLASMVGLSGCAKPPVTGDIVIGRAILLSTENYREVVQWEQENPEHRQYSIISGAIAAGIPQQTIQDGRVLAVRCEKLTNFGYYMAMFYLLLPEGVSTVDFPVVEFEAASSSWDRATQSTSYGLSKFIRLSDLGYHDVPPGCLWYHNGELVAGYDGREWWMLIWLRKEPW